MGEQRAERLSGTFYRIVFAHHADQPSIGAIHPEGRFHHDHQPAFYASPSPEAAAVAIAIYIKPADPPRALIAFQLTGANVADLRDPVTCTTLNIDPAWPSVPWADQRRARKPATSWRASDAVRDAGYDGMIYASRREPSRWHLVLFRWNIPDAPSLVQTGGATPWFAATP